VTFVKVCGVTNLEDALAAAEAGADFVGFVFAESPRRIEPEAAAAIARALPLGIRRVGVFVDEHASHVRSVAQLVGLDVVQLHGSESRQEAREVGLPVLKAFRVAGEDDLERAAAFGSDPWLLDGPSGERVDLEIAARARGRFFLAGGLDPACVVEALEKVRPYGVDVARGVEARPGKKDLRALREFVGKVRSWDAGRRR
jgi:phosphoribosylanthranilate isomerase